MSDILLVCMPFGSLFSPSLGLSLLKAALAQQQISTRIAYFSHDLGSGLGAAFGCIYSTIHFDFTYFAISSCVANQTPGFDFMYVTSRSSIAIRARCPITCGCIVRMNRPRSS
jgi:hypothetical protein